MVLFFKILETGHTCKHGACGMTLICKSLSDAFIPETKSNFPSIIEPFVFSLPPSPALINLEIKEFFYVC